MGRVHGHLRVHIFSGSPRVNQHFAVEHQPFDFPEVSPCIQGTASNAKKSVYKNDTPTIQIQKLLLILEIVCQKSRQKDQRGRLQGGRKHFKIVRTSVDISFLWTNNISKSFIYVFVYYNMTYFKCVFSHLFFNSEVSKFS